MNKTFRPLFSLLLAVTGMLGLSSCLWTKVSTHTLTDAIGKKEYAACGFETLKTAEIYRRNGVYYLKHNFYKVPARGKLYSNLVLAKDMHVEHCYLSKQPLYKEGMETVPLYAALSKWNLELLLPKAHYKAPAEGETVLTQQHFEGQAPVAVITSGKKLRSLFEMKYPDTPTERGTLNYLMMPLTGALYVADIPLTMAVTTVGWLGVNVPVLVVGFTVSTICHGAEQTADLFSSEDN